MSCNAEKNSGASSTFFFQNIHLQHFFGNNIGATIRVYQLTTVFFGIYQVAVWLRKVQLCGVRRI